MLSNSNLLQTIVALSQVPNYAHESKRNFRHGYMAAVIKLANFVQKYADKDDVRDLIARVEEWPNFVVTELKKSNDTNNRSLGGQQPRQLQDNDDDDGNHYEVNMEKIMQRFSNFSNLVNSNSNDDEEDDEEKNKHEEEAKEEEDHRNEEQKDRDEMFSHLDH